MKRFLQFVVSSLILTCCLTLLEAYEYIRGQRVRVVDVGSRHFGKVGIVKVISPAGVTNTIPPTFFGERDTVLLDGMVKTLTFDVNQLDPE